MCRLLSSGEKEKETTARFPGAAVVHAGSDSRHLISFLPTGYVCVCMYTKATEVEFCFFATRNE